MTDTITSLFDHLEHLLKYIVIALLAVMVVLISSQVAARYLVGIPLYWSEELARHMMIWMFFLGAVIALRRGAHLSIDVLADSLPATGRLLLRLLVTAILIVFFAMMTWYGWEIASRTMNQRASALHYPMGYVYAALPTSGFLMLLVGLERIVRNVAAFRDERGGRSGDASDGRGKG